MSFNKIKKGPIIANSNLNVAGTSTFNNVITTLSSFNVSGNSTLMGSSTFGSTLNIIGSMTASSANTFSSTLFVGGASTFSSSLNVVNQLNSNTISSFSGSSLNIYAASTLMSFFVGGNNSMNLNSSGYLGIGTTTQSAMLHVSGTTIINGNMGISNTNPTYKLDVTGDINFTGNLYKSGSLFSGSGGSSQWTTSGANIYYNTGNVGIGTNTPSVILHVSGNTTITGVLSIGNRLLGTTDTSPSGNFWIGLSGSGTESDRLAIDIIGTQATGFVSSINLAKNTIINGSLTMSTTLIKSGGATGYYATLAGTDALNSPYHEYYAGGLRRCYIGNATTTNVDIVTENGAQLSFSVGGTGRMNLDTSGNINITSRECIVTQNNGPGQFRAIAGIYGWFIRNDGSNTYFLVTAVNDQYGSWNSLRPFYMNNASGLINMENGFGPGNSRYIYSPETAGATYGSICVKGAGRNGWQGYSIYNTVGQQISFMMSDTSQNYGLYNATTGIWNFYVDGASGDMRVMNAGNTRGFITYNTTTSNVIYNTTATSASNITTWSGYGYTLLSNTQTPAGNAPCMGFGCNYSNTCQITCLAPAVAWMNLAIFNAQTTFTYYGNASGYTVSSGGANVSDEREKHSISNVNTANSLKKIMMIKTKYYKRKYYDTYADGKPKGTPVPDHVKNEVCIGIMAQDLLATGILAPAVTKAPMKNENIVPTDDDDGTRLGVNYGDINIHMIGAIQEIVRQNERMQKDIDELVKKVKQNSTQDTITKQLTIENTSLKEQLATLQAQMASIIAKLGL